MTPPCPDRPVVLARPIAMMMLRGAYPLLPFVNAQNTSGSALPSWTLVTMLSIVTTFSRTGLLLLLP
jgi:hypothetical protein